MENAIIWSNTYLGNWRLFVSLGSDEVSISGAGVYIGYVAIVHKNLYDHWVSNPCNTHWIL